MLLRLHTHWVTQARPEITDAAPSARPGDSWRAALEALPLEAPEPLYSPPARLAPVLPPPAVAIRARPAWVLPVLGGLLALCGTLGILVALP